MSIVARVEQLRNDLLNGDILKHRQLLIGAALFVFAFAALTIAGGYFLVTHAMDDNQTTSSHSINTPTDVALLFEGHKPFELVNSLVYLNRVKLEATEVGSVFYAGGEDGKRLLVVTHGTNPPATDSVANLMGTVRPVNTELLKKWKLNKEEQKAVKSQGVYLEADSVRVQKHSMPPK